MKTLRSMSRLAAILLAASASRTAAQGVALVLNYDPGNPPAVAVLPVTGPFGDSVRAIIQRDLDYSDRFRVLSLEGRTGADYRDSTGKVNYPIFASLGARIVVDITPISNGLHVVIHDVPTAGVPANGVKNFDVSPAGLSRDWRMGIHIISDKIHEFVLGAPGIAATRIAYYRRIAGGSIIDIVDSDGGGHATVPTDEDAYSPAWHPKGESLIYSTIGAASRILTVDLLSGGSRVLVGPRPNISYASASYFANGDSIIYTMSTGSEAGLWRAAANGSNPVRITPRNSDNVHPAMSPNGTRIAFTTNRLGHNEVYIMGADGTGPEIVQNWRDLSQESDRAEPDWSPDGTKLAFITRVGRRGDYQLMVMEMGSRTAKRLTDPGSVNQQPAWAPDGRHIVFSSDRLGHEQLFVIDTESGRIRQLTRTAGSKLPAWSPRFPGL